MQSRTSGGRKAALAACALAAAALWLAAPAAHAAARTGTVQEVVLPSTEGGSGQITVGTARGPVNFVITSTTQVFVEGDESVLSEVQVGDTALVNYSATTGGFYATKLYAERPREPFFGIVTNAENTGSAVVVTVQPIFGEALTFTVSPEAKVRIGRQKVTDMGTLTTGQLAALIGEYYVTGRFIVESALATEMLFTPRSRIPFKGDVYATETGSNTLVVTIPTEEERLSLAIVTDSTIVRLNGKLSNLASLTPGDKCVGTFFLSLEEAEVFNVASVITARTPTPIPLTGTVTEKEDLSVVSGVRTAVADPIGRLTIQLRNSTTQTITLYATTKLKVNGQTGTFAQVAVGQKVAVVCTPRPDGDDTPRLDATKLTATTPRTPR